ncbi:MAG: Ig-like domain-containing protein [Terracidiphilus sp.]
MRGIFCRGLRLELVAALSIALAMPALAMAAENSGVHGDGSSSLNAKGIGTETTLSVETRDQDGRTHATAVVTVTGEDGLPAAGAVVLSDHGRQLAGAALNAQGHASIAVDLPAGDHLLRAMYSGDAGHRGSLSQQARAQGQSGTIPSFDISVDPVTLSLTPGQTGTIAVSITPVNAAALSAPMFVTLSCSGLPDASSCTFTPENLEILPNATSAIPSSMVILTQAEFASASHPRSNSVAWAFLLPGALGLGGLAWGSRRRRWLNRLSLLALVALVTTLGATACAPRYDYYNHGPPIPPATPAGTYTITVTAQSSNGITAITKPATLALTVQ